MPRRITGFSREAAKFVKDHPGLTAEEIVEALLQSGKVSSAAINPRGSLVATLHDHHPQVGLVRRKENGRYRYYVSGSPTKVEAGPAAQDSIGPITVSPETAKVLKALVASGRYPSQPAAAAALMDRGRDTKEIQDILALYELLTEAAGKV